MSLYDEDEIMEALPSFDEDIGVELDDDNMEDTVIWVVQFPREGYKIRQNFGKKSECLNEIIVFCVKTYHQVDKKCKILTFKVN